MNKREAKRLSLLKWDFYRKHPDASEMDLLKAHPELANLLNYCGFCEYSLSIQYSYDDRGFCIHCPMFKKALLDSCQPEYDYWLHNPCKETAEAMYKKIKKTKV